MSGMYHDGSRELQDRFDTRRLADRLEQVKVHDAFSPADREFIERLDMFFIATADGVGQPTCSYKGGDPGFVRVVATRIYPNCPRYIHHYALVERSTFVPRPRQTTPIPPWKQSEWAADVLPAADPARVTKGEDR
jgi:hypothetical protein